MYDCFEELSTVERGGQDRLKFESHFESGNLRRAVWVGDNEYDLMLKVTRVDEFALNGLLSGVVVAGCKHKGQHSVVLLHGV